MNRTASSLILTATTVCAVLFGQATEGSILGAITDASGAVIPSAKVSVTNVDTGVIRTTTPTQTGAASPDSPPLTVGSAPGSRPSPSVDRLAAGSANASTTGSQRSAS